MSAAKQTSAADIRGTLFDIDTFAVHDGPGIRMTCYLKGCPLSCSWCHSPESQKPERQLIYAAGRCTVCGACVEACPTGAQQLVNGQRSIERDLCQLCGACVRVCPTNALQMRGYEISAGEVIERAVRMRPFFEHSNGGITLTGGEVTQQPEFAEAVLRGCQAEGIHTAIETCGACSWATLEQLLAHTDLVLYDIKLMDDYAHRRHTGASNRQTLANAQRLVGRNVQVRVPLIPMITDQIDNLRAIMGYMQEIGLHSLALLPYNESAGAKYEWLGREYAIEGTRQKENYLRHLLRVAEEYGLDAVVD